MYRLLLFIYLFLPALHGLAQEKVLYDTSAVSVRQFSAASLKSFKEDPVFQYDRIIEPPRSLWNRFWDWFWSQIGKMLSSETGWTTFRTVLIIMSSLILLFFILRLSGMTNNGLFGKENKTDQPGYSVSDEDIHAINFEAAIQEAINDGNFRFAVRLLYLQSLKKLADLGLISWQINKTNVAYLQELAGNRLYQPFNNLTLQFENNWYGDVPIEENEFRAVMDNFAEFNRQLR